MTAHPRRLQILFLWQIEKTENHSMVHTTPLTQYQARCYQIRYLPPRALHLSYVPTFQRSNLHHWISAELMFRLAQVRLEKRYHQAVERLLFLRETGIQRHLI